MLRINGWLMVAFFPAFAAAQGNVAENRRTDLAAFRREFFSVDNSYSTSARAEAERRIQALEAQAGTVSNAYFELELARIVALADNGHTNSPVQLRSRRYARVPLRLVPFGDQFYVLRADSANADLLGGKLVSIDGKSAGEVRTAVHTLFGGSPSWRDRHAPLVIESPDQLRFLGVTASASVATYRFELRNGRTVDRRLSADPPNANREFYPSSRWLYGEPLPSDSGAWKQLGSPERAPWAFQEPTQFFRLRHDTNLNAVVVQMRANFDANGQSIQGFMARATEEIRRIKPQHVILDLRTNGGGDLNNTRDFVQSLPGLVPGKIFVLTSPWTFSAAISTTGYLKQAGKDRVTIVGEMVGDRLEFWAEGRLARLPNSGAMMSFSTERHDYKNACRAFSDCHGSVVRNPIAVPTLEPDIPAPLTIESFISGRDPAMEAIARVLRGPIS